MDKIPTAEEFMNRPFGQKWDIQTLMIEFAKLHCEAQREAILNNVTLKFECGNISKQNCNAVFCHNCMECVDKESVINAYPLENIK